MSNPLMSDNLDAHEASLRGAEPEPVASVLAKIVWIVATAALMALAYTTIGYRVAMGVGMISLALYRLS